MVSDTKQTSAPRRLLPFSQMRPPATILVMRRKARKHVGLCFNSNSVRKNATCSSSVRETTIVHTHTQPHTHTTTHTLHLRADRLSISYVRFCVQSRHDRSANQNDRNCRWEEQKKPSKALTIKSMRNTHSGSIQSISYSASYVTALYHLHTRHTSTHTVNSTAHHSSHHLCASDDSTMVRKSCSGSNPGTCSIVNCHCCCCCYGNFSQKTKAFHLFYIFFSKKK